MSCACTRLLGCDIYSFDFKINHISRHIQLPQAPMMGVEGASLPPEQQIPPLLVLNIQLPTYPVLRHRCNSTCCVLFNGIPSRTAELLQMRFTMTANQSNV